MKNDAAFSREDLVELDEDGILHLFAPDPLTIATYQFQIKCEADGGAEIMTDLKSLEINCAETILNTTLH